ncbi:MAG: sigma-70 family RNA polymerase sigma factor [Lachnospiraceae bacterium]|nr:sigma-70 family RNA polymerase sigma factor [Lachnospiraceae bacterium]
MPKIFTPPVLEIPDDEFEKMMMRELDQSRIQEQKYLGVYTVTNKTIRDMSDGEESVRSPYKNERTVEEQFEGNYFSTEEKEQLVEDNMKLIDKCIGQFMPKNDNDRKFFCFEDIVECCNWGFLKACDNYPRTNATAKFSSFAYDIMSNECRDFIRKCKAKKRGKAVTDSLDTPVAGGDGGDKEKTIGDTLGHNFANEDFDQSEENLAMKSLISSVFEGMDEESVLILTYSFGLGMAGYPHEEYEISDILHIPRASVKKKLGEALEMFKFALYQQGLLSEAEGVLKDILGYTQDEIDDKLEDTAKIYMESFDIPISDSVNEDGDFDEESGIFTFN